MTKEQIEIWNEIVKDCNSGLRSVNVASKKRRSVINAVNKALSLANVVGQSEQLKAFFLFIQENAPNYRTKQLKPDQVIKAYLESL